MNVCAHETMPRLLLLFSIIYCSLQLFSNDSAVDFSDTSLKNPLAFSSIEVRQFQHMSWMVEVFPCLIVVQNTLSDDS